MTTTIAISNEMREKIRNLGRAGDSYDDIVRKMYNFSRKHMIMNYLYDESDSVSIDVALKEAKKQWPK